MTEAEAVEIQTALAPRVRAVGGPGRVNLVAGAVARAAGDCVRAAVVVLSLPELAEVESVIASAPPDMPYRPGFRAFHDGPALLAAIRALDAMPDVILFRGHGIAHPRGIGLASHLGVVLDLPTIGCAESPLVGECDEPGPERGDWSPIRHSEPHSARRGIWIAGDSWPSSLRSRCCFGGVGWAHNDKSAIIGAAVRTRTGCRPLLVSPGHRTGIDRAVEVVLACSRFRWPEPLRAARARLKATP